MPFRNGAKMFSITPAWATLLVPLTLELCATTLRAGMFVDSFIYMSSGEIRTRGLAICDINRDGKPDIVVANTRIHGINVLLNDGAGIFTGAPNSPYHIEAQPMSLASGDFDADGKTDIAVETDLGRVRILLGSAIGTFTIAESDFQERRRADGNAGHY